MLHQFINWKTALAFVAIFIVSGTIFYSQYLARKIAREERQKVEQWIEAGKFIISSPADADTKLASMIMTENTTIPIIETTERDSITGYVNLDSASAAQDPSYVQKKLRQFKSQNDPIEWADSRHPEVRNRYYYGHTSLLNEVQYYPIVQMLIIALFIITVFLALRSSYRSVQNQVWAGMAKETAHQLGTPVSSLEGWIEMLKENPANDKITTELEKDLNRLRLVSDRFGKIGSKPNLEEIDLVKQIEYMVEYIRKRAPGKVIFSLNTNGASEIKGMISKPLFDWVIENLLKNALDSMEGKGEIGIDIKKTDGLINIEVSDSGKGISKQNIPKVFKPGFTTKKRGWGLGLSLSKRIIEQYHKGEIFVKHSELGKGTTFKIILKK